jgi:hypothetical protein
MAGVKGIDPFLLGSNQVCSILYDFQNLKLEGGFAMLPPGSLQICVVMYSSPELIPMLPPSPVKTRGATYIQLAVDTISDDVNSRFFQVSHFQVLQFLLPRTGTAIAFKISEDLTGALFNPCQRL